MTLTFTLTDFLQVILLALLNLLVTLWVWDTLRVRGRTEARDVRNESRNERQEERAVRAEERGRR
jgi:hypothetical protein